jgi:hypothetical protein
MIVTQPHHRVSKLDIIIVIVVAKKCRSDESYSIMVGWITTTKRNKMIYGLRSYIVCDDLYDSKKLEKKTKKLPFPVGWILPNGREETNENNKCIGMRHNIPLGNGEKTRKRKQRASRRQSSCPCNKLKTYYICIHMILKESANVFCM